MTKISRRSFLKTSSTATAAGVLVLPRRVWGANDRIAVAVIGLGGEGQRHLTGWRGLAEADVVGLCDMKLDLVRRHAGTLAGSGAARPRGTTDFRAILDEPSVDAVSLALPIALQAEAAVLVLDAGKHLLLANPPLPVSRRDGQPRLARGLMADCGALAAWHLGTPSATTRAQLFGKVTGASLSHLRAGQRPAPEFLYRWLPGALELMRRDLRLPEPVAVAALGQPALQLAAHRLTIRYTFPGIEPLHVDVVARTTHEAESPTGLDATCGALQVRFSHTQGTAEFWAATRDTSRSTWERFAAAVRTSDATKLNWPIDEAARASEWTAAAVRSATEGRTLKVSAKRGEKRNERS